MIVVAFSKEAFSGKSRAGRDPVDVDVNGISGCPR